MSGMALRCTSYGRPAAELLHARVSAAKGNDPLHPVTVVVPTNYVGVSMRRLLASGALGSVTTQGVGVAGLTLATVYRLAELLGAPRLAASGRRPVSTPVLTAAIRRVLTHQPGGFAPVHDHPATEEALVWSYRELSELDAATLDALADSSPRAGEVVRLRRAARAILAPAWFEEADLMEAAEDAVRAGSPVLEDLGTVLVFLPQQLSPGAAGLLRAVADHAPVEVLAGRTGAADADADVDRTLRHLGLAPSPRPRPPGGSTPPTATSVIEVSDAEEETRTAVQRVLDSARAGVPLERMAVLYPAREPYARLLAEQFDAADVRTNGRTVRAPAERLLGRWLLDLLGLPERRHARPAVLGLLTSGPVRDEHGRRIPAASWERRSREAGVVQDRAEWHTKLTRLAESLRGRADAETDDGEHAQQRSGWRRHEADDAERLHSFVAELFDRLDTAATLTSWRDLVDWCRTTAQRYLGGEHRRQDWPEAEQRAADRVEEALDRLGALDEVESTTTLAVFRRTLELELSDDLGRTGQVGEGVLVGPASAGLGLDLDLVVMLGLAEGVFPSRPREDSLLPDSERSAARGQLPLSTERVGVEHRQLLAALAASSGQRVLTVPRGDLRRTLERVPSRWLHEIADGQREVVPSFAHRVRTSEFPATRQEYGLRALAGTPRQQLTAHPLVAADPVLRRGVELSVTRGRGGFTRFDGNLGALASQLPTPVDAGTATSTSRLETWLACPHAYLMRHVLGVTPVENPEELLEIDAMEKGALIHRVLERWLREQLDAGPPEPGQPWPDSARRRMRELAEQACDDAERRGVTGHPLLWRRDRQRLVLDLERFLDHDDQRRRAGGLTPLAAEHPFGLGDDDAGPIAVDLDDGRQIAVRGRIDRIDRDARGGLVVTDYKTGGASAYDDLTPQQPLGDGTKLQLAIYGLAAGDLDPAAPEVHSEYWFVSTRGAFKRIGYPVTAEVRAALVEALRLTTDGIAAGRFPMRPPAPGPRPYTRCVFCDPDDLGTAERHRDWERLRSAHELRDYVAFVEGET